MIIFAASICIATINLSFVYYHGLHMYLLNHNLLLLAAIDHLMTWWITSDLSSLRTVLNCEPSHMGIDRNSMTHILRSRHAPNATPIETVQGQ